MRYNARFVESIENGGKTVIPVAVSLLSRIEGRVMRIYKLPMIADGITDRGQGREKTLVEIDSIDDSTITVIDRSIHLAID